eukprot:tig00021127_g18804.t1
MILAAGIVNKNQAPIFLRVFDDSTDALRFYLLIHSSLDIVEERASKKSGGAPVPDSYLGLLLPSEDTRVYGSISNSKMKFFVVVDDAEAQDAAKTFLRKLQTLYVDAISNPLIDPETWTPSKKFERDLMAIAKAFSGG